MLFRGFGLCTRLSNSAHSWVVPTRAKSENICTGRVISGFDDPIVILSKPNPTECLSLPSGPASSTGSLDLHKLPFSQKVAHHKASPFLSNILTFSSETSLGKSLTTMQDSQTNGLYYSITQEQKHNVLLLMFGHGDLEGNGIMIGNMTQTTLKLSAFVKNLKGFEDSRITVLSTACFLGAGPALQTYEHSAPPSWPQDQTKRTIRGIILAPWTR